MKNKVSEVQYIARIAELEEENRYLKGQLDNYQKIKEEDKDSFTMDKQSLENLKSIGGDETENYIYSMKRKEGKQ